MNASSHGSRMLRVLALGAGLVTAVRAQEVNPAAAKLPSRAHWQPNQPVVVVANKDFYPYSFINQRGEWDGFVTEVFDAVARTMKLQVRRVGATPTEANANFEHGEFDVMQSLTRTPPRELFADFTMQVISLEGAVFVRRGDSSIKSVSDLNGRKFAIANRNSVGEQFVVRSGLRTENVFVGSPRVAVEMVNSGAAAATFLARYTALANCEEGHLRNVVMLGEPVPDFEVQHCFAVHKGDAELLAKLNEGLALLHQSGEYQRIFQHWFGHFDAPMFTREQAVTYIAVGLAIALLVASIGFIRAQILSRRITHLNAQLEARVSERTAELGQRVAEVELLNGELEAFSYSVSHDLRAPLRNITGFLELLNGRASGRFDPEERRFVDTVSREAARMGALIDGLLAFSRVGRTEMKLERVPLAEIVEEVRVELQPATAHRAIEWKIGALPMMEGDRLLLRQVVVNLLGNAVKFTRQRTTAVIEIGEHAPADADGMATIFVRDNGAGFNPRYADKLFGVFQRLHNQRDFEGTGIGLANVKRIVVRHGGEVWGEGKVDKGAVFYLKLKVHP